MIAALPWMRVDSYLVEVKATTQGEVRLTAKQAETATAEANRYVLCVLDLRSVQPARLAMAWTAGDIEPLTHLVTDIGVHVQSTWGLVEKARTSEVGISNEKYLRYGVPTSLWGKGCSIEKWIDSIKAPH